MPKTKRGASATAARGAPTESADAPPKRKKLRQAIEDGDAVQVLCFTCRRASEKLTQSSLAQFLSQQSQPPQFASGSEDPPPQTDLPLCCSKCRRPMEKKSRASAGTSASSSRVLPIIQRIRAYQRVASEQGVPFALSESHAAATMRQPCTTCGAASPAEGHGLTRLRLWPDNVTRPARGKLFMGPFHASNVATACGICNLMKGARRVRGFVEAARHIATHRNEERLDFGRYPHRFRNNTSKRSRSCYITESSTHTKTHALSNEAFSRLVAMPCHYCGKASDPPTHHNGLDRLDSDVRVYSEATCVSCCVRLSRDQQPPQPRTPVRAAATHHQRLRITCVQLCASRLLRAIATS